jgi:DNA-binding CsgD family transcriptional regulator
LLQAAGDEGIAAEAKLGLAQNTRDRGDLAGAAALYQETLQRQDLAGAALGVALGRYGLGTVVQAQGDPCRARDLYRESLRYWRDIGDDGSVAVCVEGIASALCVVGDAAQAVRLLGAAHAMREAIDAPVPCNALASYGGLVRSLRDSLGADTFAEAWLAGLRLSRDDAINVAMSPVAARPGPAQRADVAGSPNQPRLTPREREVLKLVAAGHSDREVAAALFISRRTASEHVGHILQKLGARSRTDAAALAVRVGLA